MVQASSRKILYFQKPKDLIPFAESLISLTPKVSVVGEDIYADIAPTEKLFGGETRTIEKAECLLRLFDEKASWVFTENMNWAKALCLKEKNIFKPGESQQLLLALPIESIALCGNPLLLKDQKKERTELVHFFKKVGLCFCSDLLKIPLPALTRRFGKLGVELFHVLQGKNEPHLPFFEPREPIVFSLETESLFSLDSLLSEIEKLLPALEARLQGRHSLIQKLKLTFFLENKTSLSKLIAFSQMTREPLIISRVIRECLQETKWTSPLHQFNLEILESVSVSPGQLNLLDDSEERFQDLGDYVYRMRLRFGENNVGFPILQDNYLPEASWTTAWPPTDSSPSYPDHSRPLFLFNPPLPFSPSRKWSLTALENLTLQWWEKSISRNYFLAENPEGERLWVYWDAQTQKWFCHGSFD